MIKNVSSVIILIIAYARCGSFTFELTSIILSSSFFSILYNEIPLVRPLIAMHSSSDCLFFTSLQFCPSQIVDVWSYGICLVCGNAWNNNLQDPLLISGRDITSPSLTGRDEGPEQKTVGLLLMRRGSYATKRQRNWKLSRTYKTRGLDSISGQYHMRRSRVGMFGHPLISAKLAWGLARKGSTNSSAVYLQFYFVLMFILKNIIKEIKQVRWYYTCKQCVVFR